MSADGFAEGVQAYEGWFDPPIAVVPGPRGDGSVGVVARLPSEDEHADPDLDVTLLGTLGVGPARICEGRQYEVCLEVKGRLDDDVIAANAEALLDLALAPRLTGRPFRLNQILTNLSLPAFPRFTSGVLLDYDPVDGFEFPAPWEDRGLLRVLPLHPSEVAHLEAAADRKLAYLELFNRGMSETDPDREPIL